MKDSLYKIIVISTVSVFFYIASCYILFCNFYSCHYV